MIVQPVIKLKTKSNNFKRYRGPPHRTMLKVILRIGLVELNSHVRVVLKKRRIQLQLCQFRKSWVFSEGLFNLILYSKKYLNHCPSTFYFILKS